MSQQISLRHGDYVEFPPEHVHEFNFDFVFKI